MFESNGVPNTGDTWLPGETQRRLIDVTVVNYDEVHGLLPRNQYKGTRFVYGTAPTHNTPRVKDPHESKTWTSVSRFAWKGESKYTPSPPDVEQKKSRVFVEPNLVTTLRGVAVVPYWSYW